MKKLISEGVYVDYKESPLLLDQAEELKKILTQKINFDKPNNFYNIKSSNQDMEFGIPVPNNNFSVTINDTGEAFALKDLQSDNMDYIKMKEFIYRVTINEKNIEKYIKYPHMVDTLKLDIEKDFKSKVDHNGLMVGTHYLTISPPGYSGAFFDKQIISQSNNTDGKLDDIYTGKYEFRVYAHLTNINI